MPQGFYKEIGPAGSKDSKVGLPLEDLKEFYDELAEIPISTDIILPALDRVVEYQNADVEAIQQAFKNTFLSYPVTKQAYYDKLKSELRQVIEPLPKLDTFTTEEALDFILAMTHQRKFDEYIKKMASKAAGDIFESIIKES